jgi:hypothetical protein
MPAGANNSKDAYLEKTFTKKEGAGGVAQGEDPEFKPQQQQQQKINREFSGK